MQCAGPIRLEVKSSIFGLLVPCGKCLPCRIRKRAEWSMRLLHERDNWNSSAFVTLTYNDDNLPENASLQKEELQKFFKRLRKNLGSQKIRYFACGEYGDLTQRPHYHSIIFGINPFNKEAQEAVIYSWPYCDWDNPLIRRGSFGLAEPDSIRYVAQYIDKKFTGIKGLLEYEFTGREPVFRILSQGLGYNYVEKNMDQLLQHKKITVNGVSHSIPRYYLKKMNLSRDEMQKIKSHAVSQDKDTIEMYTGESETFLRYEKTRAWEEVAILTDKLSRAKSQNVKNLEARIRNFERKKI